MIPNYFITFFEIYEQKSKQTTRCVLQNEDVEPSNNECTMQKTKLKRKDGAIFVISTISKSSYVATIKNDDGIKW